MNEPPLLPALVCQKCGAMNTADATRCWLCDGKGKTNPYAASEPNLKPVAQGTLSRGVSPSQKRAESVFIVLLFATVALAVIIGIGISLQEPGLLVPYLIIIGPAFLATGVRAAYGLTQGKPLQASSLFLTFLWSGVFTALVFALLVLASVIALFLWCIQLLR